jgi:hypothetical protein
MVDAPRSQLPAPADLDSPLGRTSELALRRTSARALSIVKKLALSGCVFVAILLLAEGALRLGLAWSGKPFDFRETASILRSRRDSGRGFVSGIGTRKATRPDGSTIGILHPYTGSENEHDTGRVLEHFREGVAPEEFSVMIVGGSVATMFADQQGRALEDALGRDPRLAGRKVKVLNFAHPGHKQPQQLMRVAWLFSLGYRPDVVINIDGFNEVALAWENAARGTHPLYPSYPAWGILVEDYGAMDGGALDLTLQLWKMGKEAWTLADFSISWKLYHSCLWSRFALSRLDKIQAKRVEMQNELNTKSVRFASGPVMQRQLGGPDYPTDPDAILRMCVQGWSECSRSLQALCASRGILYLHVLQPALGDRGSKPLTAKEKALPPPSEWWIRGPELGYPMLREEGRKLAEGGMNFVDASQVFASVEKDLYFDLCHFSAEGNQILEQAVEKALRARTGER